MNHAYVFIKIIKVVARRKRVMDSLSWCTLMARQKAPDNSQGIEAYITF